MISNAKFIVGYLLFAICVFGYIATTSFALPLQSSHYIFTETSLGGIGSIGQTSANYQSQDSGAILGLGTSTSTDFQIKAGNTTTNDPALAFAVNQTNVNLGTFSPTAAAVSTSTFQVLDYTSYGYAVQIVGSPPTNGTNTIAAMSSTGPSQAGVDQFGINLVANTSPSSFGANPNYGQFGYGSVASNYNTPNNFRYVSGETIATSGQSSGLTTYTISYLVNVASLTAGGQYTSSESIICTGTY